MQLVVADIGNSSVKYMPATWDEDRQGESACAADRQNCVVVDPQISGLQAPIRGSAHWFVSSVNQQIEQRFQQHCQKFDAVESWHSINYREVPIQVDLEEPEKAGIDRILAAYAAHKIYGQGNDVVVVDCGTAMTIDLISGEGVFCGGVIIAGPATNLRALNSMTSALPDLSKEQLRRPSNVLGRNTRQAIMNGAYFNGLGAVKEVVAEISTHLDTPPTVIGTGGGLGPWKEVLPAEWVLVDDLVLDGILMVAARQLSRP